MNVARQFYDGISIKACFLIGVIILFTGCSWPKIKVAGDEYLFSPVPQGHSITSPHSTSGSGSASKSIKPPESVPQK